MQSATDNRLAVWNFFKGNPCHTRQECAAALGIHRNTVERHATAIREGWRPKVDEGLTSMADEAIIEVLDVHERHGVSTSLTSSYIVEADRRGLLAEMSAGDRIKMISIYVDQVMERNDILADLTFKPVDGGSE